MRTARLDDLEVSQVRGVIAQFLNAQVVSPQGRFNKVFVSLYFHERYVPTYVLCNECDILSVGNLFSRPHRPPASEDTSRLSSSAPAPAIPLPRSAKT